MNNDLAILEISMVNHKNAASQLVGHDLDSQKLLANSLKELQKLHYYRL